LQQENEVSVFNMHNCNIICNIFSAGATFATDENRISQIIRAKDERSSFKSLEPSTRKTNYTYNRKCSNKGIGKFI